MFSVMIVGCGKIAGINKNSHAKAILANKNLNWNPEYDLNEVLTALDMVVKPVKLI